MPRGKTYWMITSSEENFQITKEYGFTFQGMMSRQRKKVQRMEPGDRLMFYIIGIRRFAATASVTSQCREDHNVIWKDQGHPEDFPWRVGIRADVILDDTAFLDGFQIGPSMEYVKRWAPEDWHMAFQGNVHILPKSDFEFIEAEMKKISSVTH